MRKAVSAILLSILLSSMLGFRNVLPSHVNVAIASSTAGTSSDIFATQYPFQRKTFFANDLFWVFYCDGTNIVYQTSADGTSWNSSKSVRSCPYGACFSIWFDGIYVHYAYFGISLCAPLCYRRGIPNSNSTITWSAPEQEAIAGSDTCYAYPFVSVDSNGYVWISYEECGTNYYPYVTKSGNNDGTWGTTPAGFPYQLSTSGDPWWRASVIPLTSGKMLVAYATGDLPYPIYVQTWTGSAWNTQVSTASSINTGITCFSVVASGDNAYIAFLKALTCDIICANYTYGTNKFAPEFTVQSAAAPYSDPVLSVDNETNSLFCFWEDFSSVNHIYYKKCVNRIWDSSPTDWVTEIDMPHYNDVTSLTCSYQSYGNHVGLLYTSGTANLYQVRFESLFLGPPPATYVLTIIGTNGGTTNPTYGTYTFVNGSSINVIANSNPICVFDHWELDGANVGGANSYTVLMDMNHTLNAFFLLFDVNNDGKVDMKDLGIAGGAFGSTLGSPRWNPIADVNHDGKIDIKDIGIIARHFGQHYP